MTSALSFLPSPSPFWPQNPTVFLTSWAQNGFGIATPINQAMSENYEHFLRDPIFFNQQALISWERLNATLYTLRRPVLKTTAQYGGYDSVFIRDQFALIAGQIVEARFAGEDRRKEVQNIQSLFRPECIVRLENKQSFLEGGDVLSTPFGITFVCHGPRSSWATIEELQGRFPQAQIIPLELSTAHFNGDQNRLKLGDYYHGDTAGRILDNGDLVVYQPALTEVAAKKLTGIVRDYGGDIYELSTNQAKAMNANIKSIGGDPGKETTKLLMATIQENQDHGRSLRDWLTDHGYEVVDLDLDYFAKSAGGAHCLVHEVPVETLSDAARKRLLEQNPHLAQVALPSTF